MFLGVSSQLQGSCRPSAREPDLGVTVTQGLESGWKLLRRNAQTKSDLTRPFPPLTGDFSIVGQEVEMFHL